MNLVDQLGNEHFFYKKPTRIVSLVPSHTETFFDFGLENDIVGITKFCVNPVHFKKLKTVVGGTKSVNFEKIAALKPDIIFCNKEENTLEMVLELRKICTVWLTDVATISDNKKMLEDFGNIFEKNDFSKNIIEQIQKKIEKLKTTTSLKKVAYLIWKNPWMAAGAETYIDSLLQINNFDNKFKTQNRYPETSIEQLSSMNLDYLLLSSEPYPFKEKNVVEMQKLLPSTKCVIVDGEMFSWHGSRLLRALDYFADLPF